MEIGVPQREIYVEPLVMPEPLRNDPEREPVTIPEKPVEEPVAP